MTGIILIGFMGAGKTTIGQLLSTETGMEHSDFDAKIVEEIGMSIQEYFDLYGEDAFREKETEMLRRLSSNNKIVSTGGGIVMRPENRDLLKQLSPVVYLKTQPDSFLSRLKEDTINIRPLVVSKSSEEIREIFEPRIPLYEESASIVIETDNKKPEEIVREILNCI